MHKIVFWLSLAYIFSIPGEVLVEDPVLGSGARLIGIVLALFWLAAIIVRGRFRKPGPFHLAVLLFVSWNGLSVFWSADLNRTVEHFETWMQLLIITLILWDLYTTRAELLAGLQMYILGNYVVIANTIFNYLSNTTYYYERFSANGTNPDDLGMVLALGIPIAWYIADSKNTFTMPLFQKLLNYAFIPAAVFGIALSGTRTALIATIPGFVFGLASLTRLKLWARIALMLLVILAISNIFSLIPRTSIDRLSTTIDELAEGNLNGRMSLWSQGLASFAQHPFLGVGSNMFRSVNFEGKVAHNSFLSVLVEVGLVGLVLYGIILLIVIVQALKLSIWDSSFWVSVLATWAIGASTLTWEYRKPTWLFLNLIIASAAMNAHHNEKEAVPLIPNAKTKVQVTSYSFGGKLQQSEKEKMYHV